MKWIKKLFCRHLDMMPDASCVDGRDPSCTKCRSCGAYFMNGCLGRVKFSDKDFYEFQYETYETAKKLYDIGNDGVEVDEKHLYRIVPFYDDFLDKKIAKKENV